MSDDPSRGVRVALTPGARAEGPAGDALSAERSLRDREELERFKVQIDLVEYAGAAGFVRNTKGKSSPNSVLMERGAEKIVVSRDQTGHWIWFSLGGTGQGRHDQGTVIEFTRREKGGSLGDARKELRRYLGTERPKLPVKAVSSIEVRAPSPRRVEERAAMLEKLERESRRVLNSPYLNSRGIRPETLVHPRFAGTFREGPRGDVRFLHRDENGICGYEWKNRGFTGFAPGGTKAVYHSTITPEDRRLVIAETAIDAISYHQLNPDELARYLSTGGTLSAYQCELVGRAMAKMPAGSTIVLITDNDGGGHRIAAQLKAIHQEKAPHLKLDHPLPAIGKDWNDVLRVQEAEWIKSLSPTVTAARGPSLGHRF